MGCLIAALALVDTSMGEQEDRAVAPVDVVTEAVIPGRIVAGPPNVKSVSSGPLWLVGACPHACCGVR
jgi:hypothetical protein